MGVPPLRMRAPALRWPFVALIAAAALVRPLTAVASNPAALRRLGSFATLVAIVLAAALLAAEFLVRKGTRRTTAALSTSLVVLLFMDAQRIASTFRSAGYVAVLILMIGIPLVLSKMSDHRWPAVLTVGVVVGALTTPLHSSLSRLRHSDGPSAIYRSDIDSDRFSLLAKPEMLVVLLDGYPGFLAWEMDYGANDRFRVALTDRDFDVPRSAWAPYWTTMLSFSSLMDMGYPADAPVDLEGRKTLFRMMSGENSMVDLARRNGYEVALVGSGWHGVTCGPAIDMCADSPWIDDLSYFLLEGSLLRPLVVRQIGHALTLGSRYSMNWLDQHAADLLANDPPTLIVAHVLAPHHPHVLDEGCQLDLSQLDRPEADRLRTHVDCVNRWLIGLVDSLPAEALVVVFSDHGPNRRGQRSFDGEWNRAMIIEGLNVLVATRSSSECSPGELVVLPNVLRRLLSCHASEPIPDVPQRMFRYPGIELDQSIVEDLMTGHLTESADGS